ncbi:MAG: monovalent cation/H+ antiporter subunit D family protein [Brachybacterium sp.]|uniref:monovalent cation/H+ antiporter subunit D family protein n=1 Tax=Brachybacterium sp. TaxID=1891286 RepID=UPI00265393DC|nr:monovalent cation/H+ antiporter subunit D family protein [Brachybacterium sp.]MDN6328448.1 monovalent cation/H+ antiporter subunit D family protein [Brachybacterium sp.]
MIPAVDPALLPLFVVVPLLGAALLVFARRRVLEDVLLVSVPVLLGAGALWLLLHHRTDPVISHAVGGFSDVLAIPFVSDTASAVMLLVTAVSTLAASVFLMLTGESRYRFVPPLVLLLSAGVNGALLTGDLFNLFVWVEVMLMPSYALIALTGTWRRLGIGRMFVLVNLLTSTVLLIGVGFVYGVEGTVNLAALAGAGSENPLTAAALAVVLLALAVKGGMVPVHSWLPRAYPATSAGVMALFSALHTKVALYAMYRIIAVTFSDGLPFLAVLAILVLATLLVGAFSTAGTSRIRTAMAHQMVAGIGHILLGLVLFTQLSLAAGLLYLVHHVLTMSALLLTTGAIEHTYGTGRIEQLSGLARRDPWVIGILALGLFSLVGLPPTSGLWGKVGLLRASAEQASAGDALLGWAAILAVLLASVGSLLGLQRVWRGMAWGEDMTTYRPDDAKTGRGAVVPLPEHVRVPWRLALPGASMIVLSLAMFVGIAAVLPTFDAAATGLLDVDAYVEAVIG